MFFSNKCKISETPSPILVSSFQPSLPCLHTVFLCTVATCHPYHKPPITDFHILYWLYGTIYWPYGCFSHIHGNSLNVPLIQMGFAVYCTVVLVTYLFILFCYPHSSVRMADELRCAY